MIKLNETREWTLEDHRNDWFKVVYIGNNSSVIKYLNGGEESLESNSRLERMSHIIPMEDFMKLPFNEFSKEVHSQNVAAGWWTDLKTGLPINANVGEKLMLIVSEVAEAMEGHRKNLMDDKLSHRKMIEVELADAIIRIADLSGHMGLDLEGAIEEKLAYNRVRLDHKIENRNSENGKKY